MKKKTTIRCPYCGAKLGEGFSFCGKCGKALPEQDI